MDSFKYILGVQCFANMDSGLFDIEMLNKWSFLDYVAISEERSIRKHPYTFPIHSIDYCMKYFNLKSINNLDLLVTDWIKSSNGKYLVQHLILVNLII